jgi:hypothetical protein
MVKGWVSRVLLLDICVCVFVRSCYLWITMMSVKVINKPCGERIEYMRLIPWTRHRGSEQLWPCSCHSGMEQLWPWLEPLLPWFEPLRPWLSSSNPDGAALAWMEHSGPAGAAQFQLETILWPRAGWSPCGPDDPAPARMEPLWIRLIRSGPGWSRSHCGAEVGKVAPRWTRRVACLA